MELEDLFILLMCILAGTLVAAAVLCLALLL
jgi:hypothetical protein